MRCPIHNLAYDPSVHTGCVICRRTTGKTRPRRATRAVVGVSAVLGLVVVAAVVGTSLVRRGGSQPAASLPQLSATQIASRVAEARGRACVVHVWATWCRTCRGELPALEAAFIELSATDVEWLLLATDDSREDVEAFAASHGLRIPIVYVPPWRPGEFGAAVRQIGGAYQDAIPYTLVLDRGGAVVSQWTGARSVGDYRNAIQRGLQR
jgi:peroxiredoxin